MTLLTALQKTSGDARQKLAAAEDQVASLRSQLRNRQGQLDQALRLGPAGAQQASALQAQIQQLQASLSQGQNNRDTARQQLAGILQAVPEAPWDLVGQLGDQLPFLLLPVRIETRFMTAGSAPELWVRIFPDDIATHTHEKDLSASEQADGQTFWREMWAAGKETNPDARQTRQQGAWAKLARSYGSPRAAWAAAQTQPASLDVPSVGDLKFPIIDPQTLKPESWSRAPRSQVMPDRFVVMGYREAKPIFRQAGAQIPNPLILGPDPQQLESQYRQEGGALQLDPDFAWISDFNEAVKKGMAIRVPIDTDTASLGLDRLLVLGLRLSADAAQSQALIEELFDNHHFSPGGFSLLPQGTPTNNTDGKGSGYSSAGPDPAESYRIELGPAAFDPALAAADRTDGQRLAEALGIAYAPLQHLAYAGQRDWREAQLMNAALFSTTGAYFLEEMLGLGLPTIDNVRTFFTTYVAGRGPLPAVRVGNQPYGILLTSNFAAWKWLDVEFIGSDAFSNGLVNLLQGFQKTWRGFSASAAHLGAGGDPFQDLLSTLGETPASIEFFRRYSMGWDTLWNYFAFRPGQFNGQRLVNAINQQALALLNELGITFSTPPRLFHLAFLRGQDPLLDPLVDDIGGDESEKLSETRPLKAAYQTPDPAAPGNMLQGNYLNWLATSSYASLKQENLQAPDGSSLPEPRPLLYRLLRSALLLAVYDTATRLYARANQLPQAARLEMEIANINPPQRSLTRWELLDVPVNKALPQIPNIDQAVGDWLLPPAGQQVAQGKRIAEIRQAIQDLSSLPTARLERVFVEHLDLGTYRLDAWLTGCFTRRLDFLRSQPGTPPPDNPTPDDLRLKGVYLGAFGWLEDLRPAGPMQTADLTGIPATLFDPHVDGDLFEQADNGGFIHAPSLNHAVAAAVLRSAYLTHFDPGQPEKMAVNLSSARVRTALSFLEGVRGGQDLGTLLGYQFERGLHDRYNDPTLNQYIPLFRARYPLVADKITPGSAASPGDVKEARSVLDGYALAEVALLRDSPQAYPYDIPGLPAPNTSQAQSIQAEVALLAATLDAVADLLLAESVFQVTQGNFERAGASLKTLTEGGMPPDPEIARTPRSGTLIHQRVSLHLPAQGAAAFWPGNPSERSRAEPALNRWLGERLPAPEKITFRASWPGSAPAEQSLAGLGIQPIDLVLLTGDVLSGQETELEKRLAYPIRRAQHQDDLAITFEFMAQPTAPGAFSLFALLPLLRRLRSLITTARPLSALDYRLPSEINTDPAASLNPQGYDLAELDSRLKGAANRFGQAINQLAAAVPLDADQNPVLTALNPESVRGLLLALASFGLPDAAPVSAFGDSNAVRQGLAAQALRLLRSAVSQQGSAATALTRAGQASLPADQRLQGYRQAAQEIFGPAFSLIPHFQASNPAELQAAAGYRDLPPAQGLLRFHSDNPLIIDEWLQGAARVRPNLANLEQIQILSELDAAPTAALKPLQLPFRSGDPWVAVEYAEGGFSPQGEYVSIAQYLPGGAFVPSQAQSGLLVDEWDEVIPNPVETTGLAIHYNQPGSQPPQTLLLAVTPEITGKWSWEKLEGILNDTLERVKQRAVEPDQLSHTAFGQLLPAVVTAVANRRFATISTDLIFQSSQHNPQP